MHVEQRKKREANRVKGAACSGLIKTRARVSILSSRSIALPGALTSLLMICGASAEPAAPSPAHRYAVAAQMVMPHLDEMRRNVVHHTRCVADDAPDGLFPVLDQHALRGCRLAYPKQSGAREDYVLLCASAMVASGTATIERHDDKLVGTLAVKMGGKNMTFSQRVEAQRGEVCVPPPAP